MNPEQRSRTIRQTLCQTLCQIVCQVVLQNGVRDSVTSGAFRQCPNSISSALTQYGIRRMNRRQTKHSKQLSGLKHLHDDSAGQAMVEFALTALMLFTLVFGMIDLSRMVYASTIVQAAATEGARSGVVDIDNIAPTVYAKMVGLDENRTQIDISMPSGDSIMVGVTYKFTFVAPIVAQIVNQQGFDLYGSASMIIR